MSRRIGVTLPPQRAAYGVTRRGYAVLRVIRAVVTIACCSMVVAVLAGLLTAWFLNVTELP